MVAQHAVSYTHLLQIFGMTEADHQSGHEEQGVHKCAQQTGHEVSYGLRLVDLPQCFEDHTGQPSHQSSGRDTYLSLIHIFSLST